jgi:dipeptide/tripeptide permease
VVLALSVEVGHQETLALRVMVALEFLILLLVHLWHMAVAAVVELLLVVHIMLPQVAGELVAEEMGLERPVGLLLQPLMDKLTGVEVEAVAEVVTELTT